MRKGSNKKYKNNLNKQGPDILDDYKSGLGIKQIKAKYGHDFFTLRDFIKDSGLELKTKSEWNKRYVMDESYFEKIDTHEKAYWLGFLYADGNLHQEGFQLCLAKKDKKHVQLLLDCMKSTHPLYKDKGAFRFFIKRRKIYNDLKKLGLNERKSLTLVPPDTKMVSEEFIPSFILGYFDGDGCIQHRQYLNNKGYKIECWRFEIIATKEMVKFVKNHIDKIAGREGAIRKENRTKENVWYLIYGGSCAGEEGKKCPVGIKNYLYKDCTVFLDRKRKKFDAICS